MARQRKVMYEFGRKFGRYVILKEIVYPDRSCKYYEIMYNLYWMWPSHYVTGTNSVCWKYDLISEHNDEIDAQLALRSKLSNDNTLF